MLDTLYTGCSAIVAGVHIVTDLLRCLIHLNCEFVLFIVHAVTEFVNLTVFGYSQIKLLTMTIATYILDIYHEVHAFFSCVISAVWKFIMIFSKFAHSCYESIISFFSACASGISTLFLSTKHFTTAAYTLCTTVADYSTSLVISAATTAFFVTTTVGSFCVNFVTGVWNGLGFVLSSVASFPMYCIQFIEGTWTKCFNAVANTLLATTKETYLGIVVLCLVYLALSNTLRYMYCRGLSLFPRRLRTRRSGANHFHFQFDPGFESDFEDMYGSDPEDRQLLNVRARDDDNNSTGDEDSEHGAEEGSESENTDVSDDDDGGDNDSDEYTVVTEESDSDASINSQTFSTESSDHEIEVQLPPVDERYSLRSRSSTPSRAPKTMNNQDEFNREMERERDKRKCVVCQDEIKSVLVLPCRHMCMCVLCADQIVRSRMVGRRVCPLCRTKITKVMNIYV